MVEITRENPFTAPNPELDEIIREVKSETEQVIHPLMEELQNLETEVREMDPAGRFSKKALVKTELTPAPINPNLKGLTETEAKRTELLIRISSLRNQVAVLQGNLEDLKMNIRASIEEG